MRIIRLSYGIRGFVRLANYSLKWTRMLTEKAKRKAKTLSFWEKHGLLATLDAFPIKRSTLFLWKQKIRKSGGNLEALNEKTKTPKTKRKRLWPQEVTREIKRLRMQHPNLAREKIYPFLLTFCQQQNFQCPKPRTIGRIISDAPDKMRVFPQKVSHFGKVKSLKRAKKLRKPKDFQVQCPGHLVELDSIERLSSGVRRYVITFVDVFSKFTFAWAYQGHSSRTASDFFFKVQKIFPFKIQYLQTDNGSEFAKDFAKAVGRTPSIHYHTYPKTPQANSHIERYNRTLQEEYIDFHACELHNLEIFNRNLMDYLIWYNTERPHWSLNLKSPIQFLLSQDAHLSKSGWPDTLY